MEKGAMVAPFSIPAAFRLPAGDALLREIICTHRRRPAAVRSIRFPGSVDRLDARRSGGKLHSTEFALVTFLIGTDF